MADIRDLKSRGEKSPCGFDSRLGHLFIGILLGLSFRLDEPTMGCSTHRFHELARIFLVMFEYKIVGLPTSSSAGAIQNALNVQAMDRWQLDRIDPQQDTQHPNRFIF